MKKILLLLLTISILVAVMVAVQNDAAEWAMRDVEITVDFDEVAQLARDANLTTREMLERLRDRGVTAVGVREAAVVRYRRSGQITAVLGSELIHAWRLTGEAPPALTLLLTDNRIQPHTTYLLLDDRELAERLVRKAELKLQKPVRWNFSEEPVVVEIDEDVTRVMSLRIGLDPRDVAIIRELGLRIVPRPDNAFLKSEEAVRETLLEFLTLPEEMIAAIVFEGTEVTGFPKHLDVAADAINDAGLPLGIIEFTDRQAGIDGLSARTGYRTLLVHPNQPGKGVSSIVNSVRERRVRIVYLRAPLTDPEAPEKLLAFVGGVTDALNQNGYRGGPARAISLPGHASWHLMLFMLGIAAAATLLFTAVLRGGFCPLWLVFLAAFAGQLALFPLLSTNLALQVLSLLTVIIFSTLAVVSQQLNRIPDHDKNSKEAFFWAMGAVIRTFLVVAAGGAIVISLTATPYFAGGTALFRGVKIVHVVPLLAIVPLAVAYIYYHQITQWAPSRLVRVIRELLFRPVLVSYLAAALFLGIAGFFYIGRTGHTGGIPVPGIELRLRELLDTLLLIRPRFKEFLIGYPLAVLGLSLLAKGSRSVLTTILVAAGSIAPVSMANTFMHFTTPTPFYSAFIRSFNGLWTGILIGLCLYATVLVLTPVWEKVVSNE